MTTLIDPIDRRCSDYHEHDKKEPVGLIFRRYIVSRIYVTLSILVTVLTLAFDPSTFHTQIHLPNFLLVTALGICAIGVIDILINDLAPDKYIFRIAYDYRHLVYMMLSLISLSIAAGITLTSGSTIFLSGLWLDGIVAAFVAVLDIFARHRGRA